MYFGGGTVIIVTLGTFDTPRRCASSEAMTVAGMATSARLIHVTVGTFDTQKNVKTE